MTGKLVLLAPLPCTQEVDLGERGRVTIRHMQGPPNATTLVLLHGWTGTSDLTWRTSYAALARHFRVVAFDHRGHGDGLHNGRRFSLEDCADDVAAVMAALGVERYIPVGYSMGGAVAQLLWLRHREAVEGLVLCATTTYFQDSLRERGLFLALSVAARLAHAAPVELRSRIAMRALTGRAGAKVHEWAIGEIARHDWLRILEAGEAIGRYDARPWIGGVDVPTAIVATASDNVVPSSRQFEMAAAIEGATVFTIPGDHAVCLQHPRVFVPRLLAACQQVAVRANHEAAPVIPFELATTVHGRGAA